MKWSRQFPISLTGPSGAMYLVVLLILACMGLDQVGPSVQMGWDGIGMSRMIRPRHSFFCSTTAMGDTLSFWAGVSAPLPMQDLGETGVNLVLDILLYCCSILLG
jgi:hypothetical protein